MEAWRREFYHSTKGSTWANHKYIRKEGNRYIYKDSATAKKDIEKLEAEKADIEYEQSEYARQTFWPEMYALFRQGFNVNILKQDPNRMLINTHEVNEFGEEEYMTPEEYLKKNNDAFDEFAKRIDDKNKAIARIRKEDERRSHWAKK